MLAEASQYAEDVGVSVGLMEGDIRHLPYSNNSFDVVLCVRFLNLAGGPDIRAVLKELARVSRGHVLIGVRYLTHFSDLGVGLLDLISRCARLSGLSRYRAVRLGRTQYRKGQVDAAIEEAGLQPLQSRLVERRWDGTDYAFLLLGKVKGVGRA
jgi:SAM-dependent methyltransferase